MTTPNSTDDIVKEIGEDVWKESRDGVRDATSGLVLVALKTLGSAWWARKKRKAAEHRASRAARAAEKAAAEAKAKGEAEEEARLKQLMDKAVEAEEVRPKFKPAGKVDSATVEPVDEPGDAAKE